MAGSIDQLYTAIANIRNDASLLRQIVQGDDQTTVNTEGGLIDAVAKVIADLEATINAAGTGWLDLAQAAATAAQSARDAAQAARDDAIAARDLAQAARDAAQAAQAAAEQAATNAGNDAAAAAAARQAAEAARDAAQAAQTAAEAAQAAAEAAKDAAQGATNTFDDIAAGLAATADGEYFVVADEAEGSLVLYRNDAGAETEILRYITSADLNITRGTAPDATPYRGDLGGAAFTEAPVQQLPVRDLTGGAATLTRDDEGMLVDVDDAATLPRADYLEPHWSTRIRNTAGAGVVVSGDGGDTVDGSSVTIPAGQTWLFVRTGDTAFIAIHMGGGGLQSLPGAVMQYRGAWDASGGSFPAGPELGDWYRVSVAGTVDGRPHAVGDAIVYNGGDAALASGWDLQDNTPPVASVAGKTGNVNLVKGDVGLGNVTNDAQLKRAQNLDDLPDKAAARGNLGTGDPFFIDSVMSTSRIVATSVIPEDGTLPQDSEGDQVLALAYNPQYADSLLKVEAWVPLARSQGTGSPTGTFALFCDDLAAGAADAIGVMRIGFAGIQWFARVIGYVAAADLDTGSPTFALRAGVSAASGDHQIEIGGDDGSGNPLYPGAPTAEISVLEIPASQQNP